MISMEQQIWNVLRIVKHSTFEDLVVGCGRFSKESMKFYVKRLIALGLVKEEQGFYIMQENAEIKAPQIKR